MECFRKAGGGVSFSRAHSTGIAMQIRCGQCIGCRLYRSREWAIRMMHEAQMHQDAGSMFLTLTYNDEELPADGSLERDAVPRFFKRLRKRLGSLRVRYFQCGEYGSENFRPHYHVALFGFRDPGLRRWSTSGAGYDLYRSPVVESAWRFGHVAVGELDFASAQYVAGYVTKKLNVSKMTSEQDFRRWEARYERLNARTGELYMVEPEFASMSNRPGLGESWLRRYWREVYPSDSVVIEGRELPPPRYYDQLMERWNPALMERVKRKRLVERDRSDDGPLRLLAMEKCGLARTNLYGGRSV